MERWKGGGGGFPKIVKINYCVIPHFEGLGLMRNNHSSIKLLPPLSILRLKKLSTLNRVTARTAVDSEATNISVTKHYICHQGMPERQCNHLYLYIGPWLLMAYGLGYGMLATLCRVMLTTWGSRSGKEWVRIWGLCKDPLKWYGFSLSTNKSWQNNIIMPYTGKGKLKLNPPVLGHDGNYWLCSQPGTYRCYIEQLRLYMFGASCAT